VLKPSLTPTERSAARSRKMKEPFCPGHNYLALRGCEFWSTRESSWVGIWIYFAKTLSTCDALPPCSRVGWWYSLALLLPTHFCFLLFILDLEDAQRLNRVAFLLMFTALISPLCYIHLATTWSCTTGDAILPPINCLDKSISSRVLKATPKSDLGRAGLLWSDQRRPRLRVAAAALLRDGLGGQEGRTWFPLHFISLQNMPS
jgi:hypothetical protein